MVLFKLMLMNPMSLRALLQQALGGESALWRDRDESAEVEDPERDMPVLAAWEEAVEPR